MRAVLSAIILFFVGLGLFGWSGYQYVASSTGEQATAVVDQCTKTYGRKGRSHTTCAGSWQANGVTQRGQIDGVGDDDEGKAVSVRIHDGEAFAFSWAGILVPAGGGVLMLIGSAVWLRVAIKGNKRTPTAPAQGWPPQHPPAPYPQAQAVQPQYAGQPYPQQYSYPPQAQRPPYPPAGYPQQQYAAPPVPRQPQPGYPPAQYPPPQQYPPAAYPPR